MHVEELIIKTKSSESKWRLVEILRNQVLDSDYSSKGIILNVSEIRRVIIFYDDNETALNMVEHIRDYMHGPGAEFGRVVCKGEYYVY